MVGVERDLPGKRPGADEAAPRPRRQAGALRPRRPEHRRRRGRLVAAGRGRRLDRLRAVLQRRQAFRARAGARCPARARGRRARSSRSSTGSASPRASSGSRSGSTPPGWPGSAAARDSSPSRRGFASSSGRRSPPRRSPRRPGSARSGPGAGRCSARNDPDKLVTACVYLWARDPKLCDAPTKAGPAFNASRAEGQIVLPAGATCTFDGGTVETAAVDGLAAVLHNRHAALSAAFSRAVLQPAAVGGGPGGAEGREQRGLQVPRRAPWVPRGADPIARDSRGRARGVIRDELRGVRPRRSSPRPAGRDDAPVDGRARGERRRHCDLSPRRAARRRRLPVSENREVGVVPVLAEAAVPLLRSDRSGRAVGSGGRRRAGPGSSR